MYAVIRDITYKPGQELSDQEREESEALLTSLPGYYGQLTVEIGDGRLIRIAVWESEEARDRGHADRSEPLRYREQYVPRMDNAIIGQGAVVSNTLVKA